MAIILTASIPNSLPVFSAFLFSAYMSGFVPKAFAAAALIYQRAFITTNITEPYSRRLLQLSEGKRTGLRHMAKYAESIKNNNCFLNFIAVYPIVDRALSLVLVQSVETKFVGNFIMNIIGIDFEFFDFDVQSVGEITEYSEKKVILGRNRKGDMRYFVFV